LDPWNGCSDVCEVSDGWDCTNLEPEDQGGLVPSTTCEEDCGDGISVGDEQCDGLYCLDTCEGCIGDGTYVISMDPDHHKLCIPNCGDNILVEGEQCEDGNSEPGDGCNEFCEIEFGYECDGIGWVDPNADDSMGDSTDSMGDTMMNRRNLNVVIPEAIPEPVEPN